MGEIDRTMKTFSLVRTRMERADGSSFVGESRLSENMLQVNVAFIPTHSALLAPLSLLQHGVLPLALSGMNYVNGAAAAATAPPQRSRPALKRSKETQ